MAPIGFEEENGILDKPPIMFYKQCQPLSVTSSVTRLLVDRPGRTLIREILRTKKAWLIVTGDAVPPVLMTGTTPFA